MNLFLYYFDKLTAWLDFSWLITTAPPKRDNKPLKVYERDPLLRHADAHLCNDRPPR